MEYGNVRVEGFSERILGLSKSRSCYFEGRLNGEEVLEGLRAPVKKSSGSETSRKSILVRQEVSEQ